jgi:phosphoribosyl-AMP cyclohydrolase
MLDFAKGDGLIPVVVQDDETGDVLMLAYMNEESLRRTRESGQVWFYSRRRQELWHKGATSGNFLNVRRILRDCDDDALVIRVQLTGPACHTGERSCFYRELADE